MSKDIYKEKLVEMNVITPPLSQEKGFKLLMDRMNEIITQLEILKAHVKIIKNGK